jgi:hypothetical protein
MGTDRPQNKVFSAYGTVAPMISTMNDYRNYWRVYFIICSYEYSTMTLIIFVCHQLHGHDDFQQWPFPLSCQCRRSPSFNQGIYIGQRGDLISITEHNAYEW